MEEAKEVKSFSVLLDYSDEEGIRSQKMVSIKINSVVLKEKSQPAYRNTKLVYTTSFSVKIPDHIHAYLIGKTVPDFKTSSRASDMVSYDSDFSKTIRRDTIESLTESWWIIIVGYEWLKNQEKADLKKVIFFDFETNSDKWKSTWNGIEFGLKSDVGYKYCMGYITNVSGKEFRYNENKLLVSTNSYDGAFYDLNFVEWSQERQWFFESMHQSFLSLIKKMDDFMCDVDETKIDELIQTKTFLIGN